MEYIIPATLLMLIFIGAAVTSLLIFIDSELKKGIKLGEILETLDGRNIKEPEEIKRERYNPPEGYVNWKELKRKEKIDIWNGEIKK